LDSPNHSNLYCQDALREEKILGDSSSAGDDEFMLKFRSSDIQDNCRRILLSHDGKGHVQGDILERIHPKHLHMLKSILQQNVDKFTEQLEKAKTDGPVPQQYANTVKRDVGQACLEELALYLQAAQKEEEEGIFHNEAFCYRCKKACPIHPPASVRGDRNYINVGGNVCIPWSGMNQSVKAEAKGWLSDFTLPMIVWLHDLKRSDVTFLVQECSVV
jgi:hypothetical protein